MLRNRTQAEEDIKISNIELTSLTFFWRDIISEHIKLQFMVYDEVATINYTTAIRCIGSSSHITVNLYDGAVRSMCKKAYSYSY